MVTSERIRVQTSGNCEIVDITDHVSHAVKQSGLRAGTVTIFVSGSTAGVTTIEYEPGLIADLQTAFERLVPQGLDYRHNNRWRDGNGHSHVRASLLGASMMVPFAENRPMLGTWQQVVLIDFDNRPRTREIIVQIMGE
jgi:secondary thiamine-phosphate synthase enzyme